MSEPWFDADFYGGIIGAALGCLGGLWGALAGFLVPRGRGKRLVVGMGWLLYLSSAALLGMGVSSFLMGQPYGVWYSLGLAGLIGAVVIGGNLVMLDRAYLIAEARKMAARDLTETEPPS